MSQDKPEKDKVSLILEGIYEAGEYHKLAKSNEKYKQKDISQARLALLDLLLTEEKIEQILSDKLNEGLMDEKDTPQILKDQAQSLHTAQMEKFK